MPVNKVVYGTKTVMDISDSTVTPENLDEGVTAYDATGTKITGTRAVMNPSDYVPKSGTTMTGELIAQANTNYTTRQVRNIITVVDGASIPSTQNGDIVLIREA